jgi:hypothetical protein
MDEEDLENPEKPLYHRRENFNAEGKAEQTPRDALDNEDLGKLAEASKLWNELLPLKKESDPDQRGWGLVAEKHLKEFISANRLREELEAEIHSEKNLGMKEATRLRAERIKKQNLEASEVVIFTSALDALRTELNGSPAAARTRWDELKTTTRGNAERRLYYLLAAKKSRDLAEAK